MNDHVKITKSDYRLFLEAPFHLWKHKHGGVNKIPTEFGIHIMNQGYEVEGFAKNHLVNIVVNADEGESVQFQKNIFR